MLTSKQRAELRSEANTLETTLMVGKGGITENVIAEAATQLEARELVKLFPFHRADDEPAAAGLVANALKLVVLVGTSRWKYDFARRSTTCRQSLFDGIAPVDPFTARHHLARTAVTRILIIAHVPYYTKSSCPRTIAHLTQGRLWLPEVNPLFRSVYYL